LSLTVAFLLAVLNVSINFIDRIHGFFAQYPEYRLTEIFINCLFFWLAALLLISFMRWREANRKRAELEDIVSSISPDTLIVVDTQRKIRVCNSSVKRVFGFTPKEVISKTTDVLYRDRRTNGAPKHEIYETLAKDGFHIGLATGTKKNGDTVPLEIITGHLSGQNGAVLLLRDISERVQAERDRQKMSSRMQQQQKLESLGVLSGGIAHDFNNLLTVMLGNAELAATDVPPASAVSESLDGIKTAARRAAELCRQLLAYAGQGQLRPVPLDMSGLVRGMMRLAEVPLGRNTALQCNLPDGVPAVNGDSKQVQQVIMNLVTNAAESIGNNEGVVTVTTGLMDCDARYLADVSIGVELQPGQYVFVEIGDSGCGMDPETARNMFDPFYTTKFTGRGLGLASVLGIVRRHNGAIKVDSRPGEGTAVRIFFPVAPLA